ncbi:MAG: hypothetical protein ACLQBX_15340 [Candidatus Limnocylindrales bacterium]
MDTRGGADAGPTLDRSQRLREACEAALRRLEAKGAAEPFAEIGEVLFWLCALSEANGRRDPLLSGVAWARNRIAHGAIVAAPVTRPSVRQTGLGASLPVPLDTGSVPVPAVWLPRSSIPVGPTERFIQYQAEAYDAYLAGRPVLAVVREALLKAG